MNEAIMSHKIKKVTQSREQKERLFRMRKDEFCSEIQE
jgi:hypothetical protein